MSSIRQLIDQYQLQPHPEGGYYLQTYCSEEKIQAEALPNRFQGARPFSTAIYFLLEGNQFSAFHRIKSDELWHFYTGTGLEIYIIHPGGIGETLKLGDDPGSGFSFQHVVPSGCWFASKPVDEIGFTFVGCTVAPGFDFADFELGDKEKLVKEYPQHVDWLEKLCRAG